MKRIAALLALALVAGLGLRQADAQTPARPLTVKARPVPLEQGRPKAARVGALTYAGGLELKSDSKDFGGFSGLDVMADGRFISQTDAGSIMTGRLVLDRRGRLTGLAETAMATLTDPEGAAYVRKDDADAEDVTFLPGGGFAVSFEQDHRVQVYQGLGPARRLATPPGAASFRPNVGLEGLAAWTDGQGRARLVEGAEDGRAWSCDLEGRDCAQILDPAVDGPEKDFNLTGLDALPDGRGLVAVYRAFDLIRGSRALIAWVQPEGARKVTVLARLAAPYTVDNMEGIAALPNADGSIRLYLCSDDNFSLAQRTLLLAFDWRDAARKR